MIIGDYSHNYDSNTINALSTIRPIPHLIKNINLIRSNFKKKPIIDSINHPRTLF
jgi:hypothetical protein